MINIHRLIFFLTSIVNYSVGFNLETRLPVIKIGAVESYFGYSVAAHQSLHGNGQVDKSWILVGAPQGQNLQPGTHRSGALWKCPVTTEHFDCSQVVTDGRRNYADDRYNDSHVFGVDAKALLPPGKDEIKDGQWLGVSVKSQGPGGKVVVCAHRYTANGTEYQWGRGLCYTLKDALDYDNVWDPCKGKPVERAHEQYGFCQAGTSSAIFDDILVMGSPGPMAWIGAVFVVGVSDDYFSRDKVTYQSPVTEPTAPVNKYSYLGMSVTAGHFYGENVTTFVAGAPRGGSGTGQVVLFTKQTGNSVLHVQLVINGEQFASSFGYEIAAADVNGDKMPDLIVAAPFYFDKSGKNVGGAVYIYLNSADHCFTCKPPLKLVGKSESRFGFALANLGDINKDGYEDLAIGAPYEGNGTVYIYLGAPDGLVTEPAQIIRSSDIPSPKLITTFGYSLSGGIDLDQNGYSDLVIGAYEQDLAVLLRTRPIIGLTISYEPEINLINIDPNRHGCADNETSTSACFSFKTCCSIKSIIKSQSGRTLQLKYRIEAETFNADQKSSRIWFNNSLANSTNIKEERYIDKGDGECQKHVAYLKENVRDIQTPISMKISYALVDPTIILPKPGDPLPSLEDLPILNQQQADKIIRATFHNDCSGNVCRSQLVTDKKLPLNFSEQSQMYELVLGEVLDLQMNVSVTNKAESAYEAHLYIVYPESVTYIGGMTSRLEVCVPLYNIIDCRLGNPLKTDNIVNVTLRFDLSKLDDSVEKTEFTIFTNSTSKEDEPQGNISVPIAVLKQTRLSVVGRSSQDSELELEAGVIKGESEMKSLEEIGPEILHTYTIYNTGTWYVSNLEVHVEWPYQVYNNGRDGKWLLYLTEKPEVVDGYCNVNASDINPAMIPPASNDYLNNSPFIPPSISGGKYADDNRKMNANSSSNAVYNRVRRSANYVVQPEISKSKSGRNEKVVNMNCLLTTARCIKMICKIEKIKRNEAAKITIKSRLWNSTLLQDYSNVDVVTISSRVKIHNVPSLIPNDFRVETVIRVNILGPQVSEPVPMFIIIAAIIIGLLIFILLTLLLWKLGFFKRRRPNALLSGNLEKQRFEY